MHRYFSVVVGMINQHIFNYNLYNVKVIKNSGRGSSKIVVLWQNYCKNLYVCIRILKNVPLREFERLSM